MRLTAVASEPFHHLDYCNTDGRDPSRWHPRAGVRVFRVQGTERMHGAKRNATEVARIVEPLSRLLAEVEDVCRTQIRRSEKLHDLFFREYPEYPTFAWQEAVVNAVAHRDYSDQGREVEIWFYDDRMEVQSPGVVIDPITIEDLRARRSVHASRNPRMVRVLVEAGIMRDEGEGIPRMFEEMAESYLGPPELSEEPGGRFQVTLFNKPILESGNRDWQTLVEELDVSDAQRRALLLHPAGFTSSDYQKLNGLDRDQAYREIQELVARHVVVAPGRPGRGAKYRVAPDLRQEIRWREARLPKIREHFSSHDRLTNADYRELFELPRQAALRELKELVDRNALLPRGKRRGAHYLAGPALGLGK